MSNIVDPNNRPIKTEEPEKTPEENGSNGKSDEGVMDIRAIPTGTLIYNLTLSVMDERAAGMAVHQMLMMKEQQKLVVEPPPLQMAKHHLEEHEKRRYTFANELNIRLRKIDAARVDECGLEVVEAPELKEDDDAPGD